MQTSASTAPVAWDDGAVGLKLLDLAARHLDCDTVDQHQQQGVDHVQAGGGVGRCQSSALAVQDAADQQV